MFGSKRGSARNELDISGVGGLENAREFLRMWAQSDGPITCFIDPHALGADPALFGMAVVDALRHGALAYSQSVGVSEDEAFARIMDGFDAEMDNPTDQPRPLGGEGEPN
ncbi:MAG: DUF5076 domain-containing protein [Allosphingosinicella sp.]